ncbi:hypothetical protein CJF42_03475 [Pseudoalteromonas sp. NBT06-2]|uniref:non-ribosomal peptide synthetase n=1 Tax=Pseudoalteromonas sp. NBT06-2 TaxID=2025950 RepID=UPI000BA6550D|nr:non-ribosomal peptide synthetase [Pseudoalteromonas sp. NBT06-2]PAJ75704.1 hypothetical protein CJF42_03475 [Pseudoalteromonas sp. NBT06-2]
MEELNLLGQLKKAKIKLWAEEGQLKFFAPKGAMTPDLKAKVRSNKAKLIALLGKSVSEVRTGISDIQPCDRQKPLAVSYPQQRMWLMEHMGQGGVHNNIPAVLKLNGSLNSENLNRALKCLVKRHESLRTVFYSSDGVPVQKILSHTAFELQLHDLTKLPQEQKKTSADELVKEQISYVFNIDEEILFRASLIKLDEDEYLLAFVKHHIISDGWSIGVLINEFSTLYNAFCGNLPDPLPSMAIQYADFAQWQRDDLSEKKISDLMGFWGPYLGDVPPVHNLPLVFPRPELQTYSASLHHLSIPDELYSKINLLSYKLNTTMFAVMQSSFALLLSLWSNEKRIVMGSPIANRTRKEVEPIIGFFVNTFVLHTEINLGDTFECLLKHNYSNLLKCYSNQDMPFDLLIDQLKTERVPSYNPLFQIMFALQDIRGNSLKLKDLNVEICRLETGGSKFDLNIQVFESDEGMSIDWEYNQNLFDEHFIGRITNSFILLLNEIVKNYQQPLSTLSYLDQSEHSALEVLCKSDTSTASNSLIHHRFEEVVKIHSDTIAVTCKGVSLTYGQLNERSNKLAHYLISQGVQPEQLVGICVSRTIYMPICILAVLKAGGAYLPLDPNTPVERFNFILGDAGIKQLLIEDDLQYLVALDGLNIVFPNQDETYAHFSKENPRLPDEKVSSSNLAYVIYTSGTTGKPKGAMVEHGNVVRLFSSCDLHFKFSSTDVWTLFHSYAFDFSVWEIWGALFYGGRLVIVPEEVARSTDLFYDLIIDEKVTVLNQTPSAFYVLAAVDSHLNKATQLRYVVFGGERLETQKLIPWVTRHGDQSPQLINMYGITETTVHATFKQITTADTDIRSNSIGVPLNDLRFYVCNEYLDQVPAGTQGELLVGGGGVTRGYHNRPELNAEKFVVNPFINDENLVGQERKLYRTGDLVRFNKQGEIDYIGRIDHQVKIRGFRIELGEIEYQLRKNSKIKDASVIVRNDNNEDNIVAYLQVADQLDNETQFISDVRYSLLQSIPEYMVPAFLVVLDVFPININGKLDTKEFPAPSLAQSNEQSYIAPDSDTERRIAQIWADELGLERVGVNDNFFELGGNSLKLVSLAVKMSQVLDKPITALMVLQNPSISQLAKAIVGQADVAKENVTKRLSQEKRKNLLKKRLRKRS